jgi:heat shock protein HslJ
MPPDDTLRFARWLLIPLLAFVVAFAAGCGGNGESDEDPGEVSAKLDPATPDSLTGKTFVSTGVKGHEMVPGTEITLSFGPGALTASAGCNSLRGPYEFEDGVLTMGKAAGTLLGCPDDRQRQDQWLTTVLTSGLRPYDDDGNLLLLGLGVEIEMAEGTVPGGSPPVVGTTWELNAYETPNGNVASVKQGVRLPYIRFDKSDGFEIFDGCNQGGGSASVNEDGTMVFGPMTTTRMACPGLSSTVAKAMRKVLNGKTSYAFEGQNLVITRQGESLTFTPG